MMISDLVADREVDIDSDNLEKWCSCIDGALTKKRLGLYIFNGVY
jgi:arsenite methyltransferase